MLHRQKLMGRRGLRFEGVTPLEHRLLDARSAVSQEENGVGLTYFMKQRLDGGGGGGEGVGCAYMW